jgi:pimeloyl-ACP methyl ester carboxylesterase
MSPRVTTVSVEGASLSVEERGEGRPLLLLHGMTGTGQDWRRLLDLDGLARRFHLIIPDARGHGRSTNPGGRFSFTQCAGDALAILDALRIQHAKAIGLSLGAKTLLHAATLAPSRVTAMVLVSATPRFPEATRALFRDAATVERSPAEWTRMRAQHGHGDEQIRRLWELPARLAESTDMSFTPEQLSRITARTLLVTGDRDPFYPVELTVEMYRAIPGSALWVVPEGLHLPVFLAERERFVQVAMGFLDAVPDATSPHDDHETGA